MPAESGTGPTRLGLALAFTQTMQAQLMNDTPMNELPAVARTDATGVSEHAETEHRPRVLFASAYPKTDSHGWYGPNNHIAKALRASGLEVDFLGVELSASYFRLRARQWLARRMGSRMQIEREPAALADYAGQVAARLQKRRYDIVVSHGTLPIAHLETDLPTVLWTDATFAGLVGYYPEFSDFAPDTVRKGNAGEQQALDRITLAIYTSNWARDSAIERYGIDPAKAVVVPFGANIEHLPTREDTEAAIAIRRTARPVRLLFIGGHWERKGGDIAIETAAELHRRGVDVELAVLGSAPEGDMPSFVRRVPYISKHSDEGRQAMVELFSESHFLLLPSRAECNANVLAEGSAQGLPALATDTGGISTSVREGCNGHLFPMAARGDAYAAAVEKYLGDQAAYDALCRSTYGEYQNRLNWVAAATAAKKAMLGVCRVRTGKRYART